ncbi:uncharacterized protein LOC142330734 [Lycorma delicatula]|uniref:uncharacterized protein LOC142330734 n=1 Tax=Lycorma delicatula TaxID=130591 RepID=UPI003F514E61
MIIITEPNIYEAAKTGWMADTVGDVVIKNMSGRLVLSFKTRTEGFVVAETDCTIIAGAYVSPNISIGDYEKYLDSIHRIVSCESKKVIMMGDFNCKSRLAGSSYNNRKGELLADLMESLGYYCINDNTPTFEARGHCSVLDLVIIDGRWGSDQYEWRVLDQDIASDHFAVKLIM